MLIPFHAIPSGTHHPGACGWRHLQLVVGRWILVCVTGAVCHPPLRWRLHPCVADSVDKLLANDYGQLNTQDRSTGAARPGGQQRVLVQFGSGHALHWAAGWAEAARVGEGPAGSSSSSSSGAALCVPCGGSGLPGQWLLELLQGVMLQCTMEGT
jgi:hypothetical protein